MATSTGSPVDTTDRRDHHQTRVDAETRAAVGGSAHRGPRPRRLLGAGVPVEPVAALRYLVHTPRLYIDDYYFDAPDTSLSWAVVVGLVAAALASRKRIAWWLLTIYLTLFAVLNAGHRGGGRERQRRRRVRRAARGRRDPDRGPQGVTRGSAAAAAWKALASSCPAWRWALCWLGLVELFQGTLPSGQRFLGPSTASPPSSWSRTNSSTATPTSSSTPCWDCSGRSPCSRGDHAVPLAAGVERADRRRRIGVARPARQLRCRRLPGLLRDPPRQGRRLRSERQGRRHLPRGDRRVPGHGDPIGNPEAWPHAIDAWLALCSKYGWAPAVIGSERAGATAYKRAGLSVLQLGDEAILETREFNLNGREMRQVRQAVHRVRKQGVTVRIRRHRDIPPAEMADVVARGSRCVARHRDRARLSMALGRLGDPPRRGTASWSRRSRGRHGAGHAVAGAVGSERRIARPDAPEPGRRQRCSRTDGPPNSRPVPTSSASVRVSLNVAVFRSTFEEGARIGAGSDPAGLAVDAAVLLPVVAARGSVPLERQVPARMGAAVLCFDDNRQLPRVGIASAIAEGFLTLPTFGHRAKAPTHTGTRARGCRRHSPSPVSCTRTAVRPTPPLRRPTRPRAGRTGRPRKSVGPAPARTGSRAHGQTRPPGRRGHRSVPRRLPAHPHGSPPRRRPRRAPGGRIAGRLLRIRTYGGVAFAVLRDWSGDIQVLIERTTVGDGSTSSPPTSTSATSWRWSGTIGRSRKGELSLLATEWRMNGKCLQPPARQVEGPDGRGNSRAAALRRPRDQPESRRLLAGAYRDREVAARHPRRPRLPRGGDADPAAYPRRRQRGPLRHPYQCVRPGPVPADRTGVVPQTSVCGR